MFPSPLQEEGAPTIKNLINFSESFQFVALYLFVEPTVVKSELSV